MSNWNPAGNPPAAGRAVLLRYMNGAGKARTAVGHYMTAMTDEAYCETTLDLDYHKAKDAFFYPAGWYVHQEWAPDFAFWLLSEPVEAWCEIPPPREPRP